MRSSLLTAIIILAGTLAGASATLSETTVVDELDIQPAD
jgi:hypothetical protein